jgi:hypothetical protein
MIATAIALGFFAGSAPRNLLINGDFRHGHRGFTTSYGLSTDLLGDGTFSIGDDPHKLHPGACSIQSHKTRGSMLLLNGSATANISFWSETIKVEPHHHYHFSGWATSWSKSVIDQSPSDISPARILARVNAKPVGSTFVVDGKSGDWKKFEFDWDSGDETMAKIKLYDENTDIVGNDFAIDDLSFSESIERVK